MNPPEQCVKLRVRADGAGGGAELLLLRCGRESGWLGVHVIGCGGREVKIVV